MEERNETISLRAEGTDNAKSSSNNYDKPPTSIRKEWDQTWLRKNANNMFSKKTTFVIKRVIIIFVSFMLICWGTFIFVYVMEHMEYAQNICSFVKESNYFMNGTFIKNNDTLSSKEMQLLNKNPELFLWDKCI